MGVWHPHQHAHNASQVQTKGREIKRLGEIMEGSAFNSNAWHVDMFKIMRPIRMFIA